ncbi:MAG: aromatic ring-hydroxylating dioxygenase subunit alpha [Pirellulales bacterium]|nr:aromatic ring-hydroxylating dioxygenase subunit alpha [Pirellulales bacterium]
MSPFVRHSQAKARSTPASALPASWYFDEETLALERRRLFAAAPGYVGHDALVPQEGDYAALDGQYAGEALVRSADGVARLVANVCRHRQAELVTGRGHVKRLVCPMHNWAYDLTGKQVAAPRFDRLPCLDLAARPVTRWNNLLFAGPGDPAAELAAVGKWPELAASADYVLARVDSEAIDVNWKLFMEVYLEDYHVGVVHPGFRNFVDVSELDAEPDFVVGPRLFAERVGVDWPLAKAGSPAFAEFQRLLVDASRGDKPPYGAVWLAYFPHMLLEWYPYTFVASTYWPLSPQSTLVQAEYYMDRRIVSERQDLVAATLAMLDEVTGEDLGVCYALHRGRSALWRRGAGDPPGPYHEPMEQGLAQFHRWVRNALG